MAIYYYKINKNNIFKFKTDYITISVSKFNCGRPRETILDEHVRLVHASTRPGAARLATTISKRIALRHLHQLGLQSKTNMVL